MNEINLLPKNTIVSLRQERSVSIFRKIAITILALTAFTSVAVFILVLQSPLSKLEKEEKRLLGVIANSSNKLSRNIIIQERLSAITSIKKTNSQYDKKLSVLLRSLPENVTITSLDIVLDTAKISGNTDSLEKANSFFANLTDLQAKKDTLKTVISKSFILQPKNNRYYFIIELTLL
jgi:Tfp pilus assembly protein PilN